MTVGTPKQRRRARVVVLLMAALLGTAIFLVPENDTAQIGLGLLAPGLGLYAPYVYVFDRNEAPDHQYRDPKQDDAERHCDDCGERYVVAAYEQVNCPTCGATSHGVSECDAVHD